MIASLYICIACLLATAAEHSAFGQTPADASPSADEAQPAWLLALLKPGDDPARQPLPCAKEPTNTATGEGFGLSGCAGFKTQLKANLDLRVGNVLAYLQEGKDLWFDNASSTKDAGPFCLKRNAIPTPVCAPKKDGSTADVDAKCGARSPRKDGFCKYDDESGVAFDTCGFEPALFYGLQNRILTNKTNELKKSIDTGEITLVSIPDKQDGASPIIPCLAYAEQLRKALAGDDKNPGFISTIDKLGYNLGVQGHCVENGVVPSNAQLIASTPDFMKALLKTSELKPKGGEAGAYIADQSACQLKMARTSIEFLFLDLATCEVMYRALPLRMKYERFASITSSLDEKVIQPCTATAASNSGGASGKWAAFYACYAKGPSSVFAFFDSLYASLGPYDPTPISVKKTIKRQSIPECSAQAADPAVAQILSGTAAGQSLAGK